MRDYRDAKIMARALRTGLAEQQLTVTHSQSLELTARAFGFDNWNILAAKIGATEPAAAEPEPEGGGGGGKTLFCSFCGKSQHEVKTLIAGPGSFICDACVGLCNDIVEHGAVAALLAADELENGRGGARPRVDAYLAGRTAEQLTAYQVKMEADLTRTRAGLADLDAAKAARAEGREPPASLQDVSAAELATRRTRLDKQLASLLTIFEIVTAALAARD